MRWLLCVAVLLVGVTLSAQESRRGTGESEDLMREELDWLKRAWEEKKKEHEEEFGKEATESEGKNVIEQIIGKMKVVERYLTKEDVGKTTQRKEAEIIQMLNDLIRKIEERAQRQGQGQGQKQQQQQQGQRQGKRQQGRRRMSDPNRNQNAQPGSQRAKAFLKKGVLPGDAVGPRLAPHAARSGWSPILPGTRKSDADAGAAEKYPHKFEKVIKRYYEKVLKGRK